MQRHWCFSHAALGVSELAAQTRFACCGLPDHKRGSLNHLRQHHNGPERNARDLAFLRIASEVGLAFVRLWPQHDGDAAELTAVFHDDLHDHGERHREHHANRSPHPVPEDEGEKDHES